MRRRLDLALFAALWLLAISLFASFWFDIKFSFNIFSMKHWAYLATLQTGTESVKPSFYFFLAAFALLAATGTYLILHHRHRKIIAMIRENEKEREAAAQQAAYNPYSAAGMLQRPQKIISGAPVAAASYPAATAGATAKPAAPQITIPTPVPVARSGSVPDMSDTEKQMETILSNANYRPKKRPKINGKFPSAFAIGANEVLLIGIVQKSAGEIQVQEGSDAIWTDESGSYPSPVGVISDMSTRLQALFAETLDPSLSINVRPFVVMDGGEIQNYDAVAEIWGTYGVMVFRSLREFYDLMTQNPGEKVQFDERDDFEAYSEYIDTVISYFDTRS